MGIGMLLVATREPQFSAALQPLVGGTWLRNPVAYVLLFGVASPLVLYRGPLNPFGVGIAIFTALLTAHVLPAVVLVAAIMAVVQVQNVCDPTNTANVWVANFTGVPIVTITKRTLAYQTAVAIGATLAVVVAAPALFGERPFLSLAQPARADETLPGFYAAASARDRIAVDDDGTALGRAAADAVAAGLARGAWQTIRLHEDPNASDCSQKRYAAYLYVADFELCADRRRRSRRWPSPGRLRRLDRLGMARSSSSLRLLRRATQARALAMQGVARLRAWARAQPVRSANLFRIGVAAQLRRQAHVLLCLF